MRNPLTGRWVLWLVIATSPVAMAQSSPTSSGADSPAVTEAVAPIEPATVRFRDRVMFEVTRPVGELDLEQRARAIEQRLLALAGTGPEVLETLRSIERGERTELYGGDLLIRTITPEDAAGTGRTRRQLAADQILLIRTALEIEFRDRSYSRLLRSAAYAAGATVLFIVLLNALLRLHRVIRVRITRAASRWHWESSLATLELASPATVSGIARGLAATLSWLLGLGLTYFYLEFTLSLFPWTRGVATAMVEATENAILGVGGSLWAYLPNIINIAVVIVLTRLLLKVLFAIFLRLREGRMTLPGFYAEWAIPTYSLTRFLVISVAAVMIFPYPPGSGSEGFRGVSVFVGLLISLGAASAIANVIAGIVITYMRPFKVGDRVRIADAVGDVTGKDLFVVRLRTIKNVDITIPNALVLANHIVNFSSSAAELGLVLHTSVTIGYDVPWKTVRDLLVSAAGRVEGILETPVPFVLQTSLDDFYVRYELNAYTREANAMAVLYSRLHAEIQDAFNAAGVEIMSPHYSAVRDGNRSTLPDAYLPKDYRTPGFTFFAQARRSEPES